MNSLSLFPLVLLRFASIFLIKKRKINKQLSSSDQLFKCHFMSTIRLNRPVNNNIHSSVPIRMNIDQTSISSGSFILVCYEISYHVAVQSLSGYVLASDLYFFASFALSFSAVNWSEREERIDLVFWLVDERNFRSDRNDREHKARVEQNTWTVKCLKMCFSSCSSLLIEDEGKRKKGQTADDWDKRVMKENRIPRTIVEEKVFWMRNLFQWQCCFSIIRRFWSSIDVYTY